MNRDIKTNIKLNKPVVLVGMMGCGKSATGIRLAELLKLEFIDLDYYIEKSESLTISEIFDIKGEGYFRNLESEKIADIIKNKECILSPGGGAFINEESRKIILDNTISVWIRADFDVLYERLSRKSHRPLLEKGNKVEIIKDLMEKRYPIYQQADIVVDTTEAPHEVVVNKILAELEKFITKE